MRYLTMKLFELARSKNVTFVTIFIMMATFTAGFFLLRLHHNSQNRSGVFLEYLSNVPPNFLERVVENIPEVYQLRAMTFLAPFYHSMFSRQEANQLWLISAPIY